MAFALVGSAGAVSVGAVNTAVTPAYGQTPTAGNLLLLFVSGTGAQTFPSIPAGWTGEQHTTATGAASATLWWKVAAGGDAAPTIAAVASVVLSAHLEEWSGGTTSDKLGSANATSSPITATLSAANSAANELVAMVGADFRSVARASNDTWTSNHGTPTLRASNNGVSSTSHYSHATLISNSAAAADTAIMTLSITTSITGLAVVAVSFLLAAAGGSLLVTPLRPYRGLLPR